MLKTNIFKKWDIIIIVFLLLISFLPEIIFGTSLIKNYNQTHAEIIVDGKFYKKIPLSTHSNTDEFTITTNNGFNNIIVKENTISISDANCSDHICINQGFISKPGQTIVCLPNKIVIEIKGTISDDDDIILSH